MSGVLIVYIDNDPVNKEKPFLLINMKDFYNCRIYKNNVQSIW